MDVWKFQVCLPSHFKVYFISIGTPRYVRKFQIFKVSGNSITRWLIWSRISRKKKISERFSRVFKSVEVLNRTQHDSLDSLSVPWSQLQKGCQNEKNINTEKNWLFLKLESNSCEITHPFLSHIARSHLAMLWCYNRKEKVLRQNLVKMSQF